MRVEQIKVDSDVLRRNVLAIHDFQENDDLACEEVAYRTKFSPIYVSCCVALDALALIHRLEDHGFRLAECKIRTCVKLQKLFDVSHYPYIYERVTSLDCLEDVLEIAGSTVTHDRFTTDMAISRGLSGERYRNYVVQSFTSPDQEVWRLYCPLTKKTLNFRTHRVVSSREVLLLLGGVHPDLKGLGIGPIASYFCLNELYARGFRRATTHISAINAPIANLEIGNLGFRVIGAFAVLRKVYGDGL